jgi:hypothetical protein
LSQPDVDKRDANACLTNGKQRASFTNSRRLCVCDRRSDEILSCA